MMFSIVLFLLVFFYWHLGLSVRIWLGILIGFVVDSLSLFPFGTYILVFILAAPLVETLRHIFSNTDSLFTKGIAVGFVFFLTNSIIYPISYVLGRWHKNFIVWDLRLAVDIIIWSLVPAAVLVAVFGLVHFFQTKKRQG